MNNYDSMQWGGQKTIILSTMNRLGGTNYFQAYSWFLLGGIIIIFSLGI